MTTATHLLQLSLGPVQGFIASARRSRDLWFGSYVLSEISKATALSLSESGATLIFPSAPGGKADLEPKSEFLVANIVTAELAAKDLKEAKAVLLAAERAAECRWEQLCAEARQKIGRKDGSLPASRIDAAMAFIRDDVWTAQLSDVVEVFRAAVPLAEGYPAANKALRTLMANRKNTRDFRPYADCFNLPKSSLDGAQSTVITEEASSAMRRALGIEPAEQLDTAGMVKRVVGSRRGFVPVARAAAAPWLEKVAERPADLKALVDAFQPLVKRHDLATKLDQRYEEYRWIKPFPFDAELLYAERIDAELARREWAMLEGGRATDDDPNLDGAVKKLQQVLAKLKNGPPGQPAQGLGEPPQYYGLLLADGDRMGKLIDKASERGADAHREVSAALSAFAQAVPRCMSNHGGACIYSGGDDVLGIVSLPKALECAAALADEFHRRLGVVACGNKLPPEEWPTLSVGIAVAHFLEPLGDVRLQAGEAERLAKGNGLPEERQRNSLALLIKPRSGDALSFRLRWDESDRRQMLADWLADFASGVLPRGLPGELQRQWKLCCDVYDPGDADRIEAFSTLWRALVTTLLARKRDSGDGEPLGEATIGTLVARLCEVPPDARTSGHVLLKDHLDLMSAAVWLSGRAEISST